MNNNTLKLFWKSEGGESYNVGILSLKEGKYYFQYNESEVKKAADKGFAPLENFPRVNAKYFKEELFSTFEAWIGEKNNKAEDMLQVLKNVGKDQFHFLEEEVS